MRPEDRIVITGIGLTAPNGNSLKEFRKSLLEGRSGVTRFETRFMGEVLAGVCDFDELKYQKKKSLRRGTRAGSIAIYCSQEAVADSGIAFDTVDKSRVGVYLGTTEHGNVETENEVHAISKYDYDTKYWSHHHNPRTVANNPAGEVTLNMGITGPPLRHRSGLCGRQPGHHPGGPDAAVERGRPGFCRRRFRKYSHLWYIRQLQERRRVG